MKGYPNILGKYFKQENERLWLLSQQHSQNHSNPGSASSWFCKLLVHNEMEHLGRHIPRGTLHSETRLREGKLK